VKEKVINQIRVWFEPGRNGLSHAKHTNQMGTKIHAEIGGRKWNFARET